MRRCTRNDCSRIASLGIARIRVVAASLLLSGALSAIGCQSGIVSNPASITRGPDLALQLAISPMGLDFGNTTVGTTTAQDVTITNTGNGNVVLDQRAVTGTGFSTEGIGSNLILGPNQSVTLRVSFRPTAAGTVVGSVSLSSSRSSWPIGIALTGVGVQNGHSVTLNWDSGASPVLGYNVYRMTPFEGAWARLNTSVIRATSYIDSAVEGGQLYAYAVSAIDPDNVESALSDPVSVTIPL